MRLRVDGRKCIFRKRCENADVRCQRQSLLSSGAEAKIAGSNRSLMCVRFMTSFYAFTSVFVWTDENAT